MGPGTVTVSSRAVLTFTTAQGQLVNYTISRSKTGWTEAEAKAVMQTMIATNALDSERGAPNAPKHAKFINTTRTRLI